MVTILQESMSQEGTGGARVGVGKATDPTLRPRLGVRGVGSADTRWQGWQPLADRKSGQGWGGWVLALAAVPPLMVEVAPRLVALRQVGAVEEAVRLDVGPPSGWSCAADQTRDGAMVWLLHRLLEALPRLPWFRW